MVSSGTRSLQALSSSETVVLGLLTWVLTWLKTFFELGHSADWPGGIVWLYPPQGSGRPAQKLHPGYWALRGHCRLSQLGLNSKMSVTMNCAFGSLMVTEDDLPSASISGGSVGVKHG